MKNPAYITTVERTDPQYHRSPVILHKNFEWHLGDFENMDQLDFLAQTLGFTYTMSEEQESERFGLYRRYEIDRRFNDNEGFWNREDVPADAKPIKALANGSIVTCYFTNDGETITIYRPNPNAKEVYKPLPIQDHIAHVRIYGLF